jgi:hypothetical protein
MKHQGYDIKKLKGKYIRLNIMKNSFGLMGPDITTHLYAEYTKGDYLELPNAEETALLVPYYENKTIFNKQ